jgi:IclR family acetate operon transcriptional repressor
MELLARRSPMGVRAVAQALKIPLGSAHRILLDLAEESVVERTPDGEWELSYRLLEITGMQLDRIDLLRLVRPYAEQMAAATGETVNLNALTGINGVCIDKVRGNEGMQLDWRIGSRGPLYAGGAGKALLAYLSEADQERVFAAPMPPFTDKTITTARALKAELSRIRARGYSLDNQEVVMGVWCVAVPIFDRAGRPVAAISITGPSEKREGSAIEPTVLMLVEACAQISRRFGYSGEWPRLDAPARKRA